MPNRCAAVGVAKIVSIDEKVNGNEAESYIQSYTIASYTPILGSGKFGTTHKVNLDKHGESALKKISGITELYKEKNAFNHEIVGKHPNANIVQFYQAWQKSENLFIHMELCMFSCERIAPFFQHCKKSNSQWIFLEDCCKGLQHMHSKNIFHLDVKLANILLGHDYNFKLCDFGCSVRSNKEHFVHGEHVGGKFLAPELNELVVKHFHVSGKVDVYALGECVKILTSEKVFECDAHLNSTVQSMKIENHSERPSASDILKKVEDKNISQYRNDIQATFECIKKHNDELTADSADIENAKMQLVQKLKTAEPNKKKHCASRSKPDFLLENPDFKINQQLFKD